MANNETSTREHRNSSVYDPLVQQQSKYQKCMSKKKNKMFFCFCLGFLLSTVLGFTAYWLTEGIYEINKIIGESRTTMTPTTNGCQKSIVAFEDIQPDKEVTEYRMSNITHVIIKPIIVQSNGSLEFAISREKEQFKLMVEQFEKFPNLKQMFCLTDIGGADFSSSAMKNWETRRNLLNSIIYTILEHRLDGIDMFWHWQKSQNDCTMVTEFCKELRAELTKLMIELRRKEAYVISVTLSGQRNPYPVRETEFDELLKNVDFLNIDAAGYYGTWYPDYPELTGPSSPLFSNLGNSKEKNVDYTMKDYICQTRQPNKINMVVEFVGNHWENVIKPENPSQTLWMTAEPINGTIRGGSIQWKDLEKSGWNVSAASWNDDSKTPYIWKPDERKYMAFEIAKSLEEKIKYATENNIGGMVIWRIEHDDNENNMLKTLSSAKLCSGIDNTAVNYKCV